VTADQVAALDEVSAIELGFPYDTVYKRERIVKFVYGGLRAKIVTL
jgi:hypothetical protein